MSGEQRTVSVSSWIDRDRSACDVTIWPINDGVARHPELRGRMSMTLCCGVANVSLRPTAAEARDLIDALQWALANDADPLGAAT